MTLLTAPVGRMPSVKLLLGLQHFRALFERVGRPREVAVAIVDKLLALSETLGLTDEIDGVFEYLGALVAETSVWDTSQDLGVVPAVRTDAGTFSQAFLDTQEKICQVVLRISTGNPFKDIQLLMHVRKKYLHKAPANIIHTYPALVSAVLDRLHLLGVYFRRVGQGAKDAHAFGALLVASAFRSLLVVIDELYEHHAEYHAERILRLYLDAAGVADQLEQQQLSYEFFNQGFVVYEECMVGGGRGARTTPHDAAAGGSRGYMAVLAIANKLYTLRNFSKENFELLITKLTLYGLRLLKKQDQCRAVYLCAHLWYWCEFFPEETEKDAEKGGEESVIRDFKRVLECLQKALRVADSCMDPYLSLKLFVEILNRCLIFNVPDAEGSSVIDARYINGLIELIRTNVDNLREDGDDGDAERAVFRDGNGFFERTLEYISEEQSAEGYFEGVEVR